MKKQENVKIVRFADFLRVQIHSWNANVCESCSLFHQGEEQFDTSSNLNLQEDTEMLVVDSLYHDLF